LHLFLSQNQQNRQNFISRQGKPANRRLSSGNTVVEPLTALIVLQVLKVL